MAEPLLMLDGHIVPQTRKVGMNVCYQASRSLLKGAIAVLQGVVAIVFVCMAVTVVSCLAQGSL
jgi:hypothetical protein